jgi:hypothetical protein
MITVRCPHYDNTPIGELCERCEQEGVGVLELDADGEGVITFLVSISKGLKPEDYEDLLSQEERDEALVRRKLMTEEELEEGMFVPYEEDPLSAEEDAYEDELVWKLNARLTDLAGDMWGRATLYVVPEEPGSSWAHTIFSASPDEVRAALEGQVDPQD